MSSHPHSTDDAAVIDAALAPNGAFSSNRGATPARDISAGTLSGVETVPTASPSLAVGTTYFQTPALSCFHTGGSLGGASAPSFSLVR